MENAVDALKMAFAVLFFVGALGISMVTFTKARETADILLYSKDSTNYYEYVEPSKNKSRVVGVETIIPTLYRYYKENYTVQFKTGRLNEDGTLETTGNLYIYTTKTNPDNWNNTYYNYENREDPDSLRISAFDLDDENKRHEPWAGNVKDIKLNLDAFITGGRYVYQTSSTGEPAVWVDYNNFNNTGMGFYEACKTKKYQFVETLGEYASGEIVYKRDENGDVVLGPDGNPIIDYETTDTSTVIDIDGQIVNLLKPKTKRIITYTLITN